MPRSLYTFLRFQRLDAALSRPPSPHLSSAPREPAAWSGHLVVPPVQADLLSHWLMSPGRPNLQEERQKGSIEADRESFHSLDFVVTSLCASRSFRQNAAKSKLTRSSLPCADMRIYSSLSPLDLHARGAEICRAILARDDSTRSIYGQRELTLLRCNRKLTSQANSPCSRRLGLDSYVRSRSFDSSSRYGRIQSVRRLFTVASRSDVLPTTLRSLSCFQRIKSELLLSFRLRLIVIDDLFIFHRRHISSSLPTCHLLFILLLSKRLSSIDSFARTGITSDFTS
jgi:hypothetical protein